jgi:pimeloyl-ACP methyl ester carboxylesterase
MSTVMATALTDAWRRGERCVTIAAMSDEPATLGEFTTRLDGLRFFYRASTVRPPSGAPAIVHVHGFGISGTYLTPTASRLAPFFRTYVPDLPGFGRSQHPRHPLGIPALADAIARFMDLVGLDRATLLGNSLGCPITAAFATAHPDRIERAILVSPAGGPHNRPIVKGVAQLALAGLREPLGMAPIAVNDYLHYGLIQTYDLFKSMIAFPIVERFLGLDLPMLVVLGDRDPLVSERRIRFGVSQLPAATLVSIDGAAHAINYSHPEQLANVVRAYMDDRPIVDEPAFKGRVRLIPPLSADAALDAAERQQLADVEAGLLAADRRRDIAASEPRVRAWSPHGPVVSDISGTGPPVILLHGLAGSARWWRRNTPALGRSFTVHAIDLPGFGSSRREARFVLDDAPAQLVATMDRLGVERASIVGHSMGGLVAAGLAAEFPERVDRLVLVDAGFLSLDPHLRHRITGPMRTLRWTSPSLLPTLAWDSIRSGPIRLAEATTQLLRADWRAKLSRIQASTLVIWGEHDAVCPIGIGRSIVAVVPGSRLVIIEGAAHNPMWERPEAFDREVLAFLRAGAGPVTQPAVVHVAG